MLLRGGHLCLCSDREVNLLYSLLLFLLQGFQESTCVILTFPLPLRLFTTCCTLSSFFKFSGAHLCNSHILSHTKVLSACYTS